MKFVIITLLFIFSLLTLAPNMQGVQFLKIGEMIEHYENDYSNKGKDITSFIDFLKEHYSQQVDLEKDEHKELPFKTITPTFFQLSINDLKIQAVIVENKVEFLEKKYYSEPKFSDIQLLYSIWNPPRI